MQCDSDCHCDSMRVPYRANGHTHLAKTQHPNLATHVRTCPPPQRSAQPSHDLRTRIAAQFDLVPVGVAEFELLPIALCSPCRTDRILNRNAFGF